MLHRLDLVLAALNGDGEKDHKGVAPLAHEPAQQAFVAGLQKLLKEAVDLLDDKSKKDADGHLIDMRPTVQELQKNLEALLQKKP